ncbi:MAG TPA: cob(I)yrinic acid a,c-diamide adenosyltransferase [Hyphomicrobiaceae bacterium]|jgi:cob(I)alamin adenosyltransferase|nr:cob(I)yrinic acid a,c-diamide adenosyltransferase [Hyphomicrobiaceae bacterium]
MVVLNRIYTRTGDGGTTALGTGVRVPKHSQRIAAYGSVDETNAAVGMARQHLAGSVPGSAGPTGTHADLDAMLVRIQNDLFDLGADLCAPEEPRTGEGTGQGTGQAPKRERLRVSEAQVERLEQEIDGMNAQLAPLRSFVLPGGSPAAAALHVARTVCRRAEREIVALADQPGERVSPPVLKYINRLSDLLFVASRTVNDLGKSDVLWVPGGNR